NRRKRFLSHRLVDTLRSRNQVCRPGNLWCILMAIGWIVTVPLAMNEFDRCMIARPHAIHHHTAAHQQREEQGHKGDPRGDVAETDGHDLPPYLNRPSRSTGSSQLWAGNSDDWAASVVLPWQPGVGTDGFLY